MSICLQSMSTEKLNFRSTIKLTKNNLISLFGLKKKLYGLIHEKYVKE